MSADTAGMHRPGSLWSGAWRMVPVLFLLAPGSVRAQDIPAEPRDLLQGTVLHELTLEPVAGAVLAIPQLRLEAESLADGSFRFPDAVAGSYQLRVSAPGYVTLVEQVDIEDDATLHLQVLLPGLDAILGALNVVARPEGRTVTAGEGAPGSALDLLRTMPGLRMFGQTGNVGQTRGGVNLRGVSSFTQSEAPLIVLDGVRIGQADNVVDVLSQIPAGDVRDIQVLPGPSAAFEHGFAANGVIRIRTRQADP